MEHIVKSVLKSTFVAKNKGDNVCVETNKWFKIWRDELKPYMSLLVEHGFIRRIQARRLTYMVVRCISVEDIDKLCG